MSLTKVTYSMISGAVANVLDFGAVGDGVTDDTAAIQAAIDSVNQLGTVFFPAGTYKITDTLDIIYTNVWHAVNLLGVGNGSKIDWRGGDNKSMLHTRGVSGSGWYAKPYIEKLYFYGNAFTGDPYNNVTAIQVGDTPQNVFSGVCNFTVRDCVISHTTIGILGYYESDEVTIQNCYIERFTGYGIKNDFGGSAWNIVENHISDGSATSVGIFSCLSGTRIEGNIIQGSQFSVGVQIVGGATYQGKIPSVINNYIESQLDTDYGIYFEGVETGLIENNTFNGCRGASLIYLGDVGGVSCDNIRIGPNRHTQSGGFIDYLVFATAGTTNCTIYGEQYTDGAITTISGTFSFKLQNGVSNIRSINVGGGAFTASDATSVAAFGSHPQPTTDNTYTAGTTAKRWSNVFGMQMTLTDGVTEPITIAGHAVLFVDSADGDLKVKFGDGTVKTIATDT